MRQIDLCDTPAVQPVWSSFFFLKMFIPGQHMVQDQSWHIAVFVGSSRYLFPIKYTILVAMWHPPRGNVIGTWGMRGSVCPYGARAGDSHLNKEGVTPSSVCGPCHSSCSSQVEGNCHLLQRKEGGPGYLQKLKKLMWAVDIVEIV